MIPIAFYAPLKSPEDRVPSGDRTMARLLLRALRLAGFEPVLASGLRSLDIRGDAAVQAEIAGRAEAEVERLVAGFRAEPAERRPRLWFTYHCYYKAPDLIGPRVASALAIPYAIAEGSRATKRAHGRWASWHTAAEAALDRADHLFVIAPQDREALERARPSDQTITDLPPFLDADVWRADFSDAPHQGYAATPDVFLPPCGEGGPERSGGPDGGRAARVHLSASVTPPTPGRSFASTRPSPQGGGLVPATPSRQRIYSTAPGQGDKTNPGQPANAPPLRLLAVAMMRPGDKLASYRLLADALARLDGDAEWTLDIVGDGSARGEVEAAFSAFEGRVRFRGAITEPAQLAAFYRAADLLVWPAVNEAYGMVFLEAQAAGCPVLAGREGGVPAVLRDGQTGFLVPPRDAAAFAARLGRLIAQPAILAPMREAGRRFVHEERGLGGAAAILRAALAPPTGRVAPIEAA